METDKVDDSSPQLTDSPASFLAATRSRNILDYIFFLRPILHPPVWTILILGYFRSPVRRDSMIDLPWLLLLSSGAAGWAYIVNQIADIESDRTNRKLFFLPLSLITKKAAIRLAIIIGGATVIGGFLLNTIIGFLFAIGIVLGYFYSGWPFNGQNNPVAGTLLNGIAHGGLVFVAGYVGAGGPLVRATVLSMPYFFSVIAVFIGTTLPDIQGDKEIGKNTPGVAMGIKSSAIAMTLSLMAAILSALFFWDPLFLIAANLSLPFYLIAAIRPDVSKSILAIKISILLLSIAACLCVWPYAVLLAFLFVITRIYYRARLGIAYPRLT
jgi:4-hydroxybenzoate polyprenyltransferase